MSVVGKDGVQIGRIRRAGLGNVKAAALAAGQDPARVARDIGILRAVANGTPASAAARYRVTPKTVWRVLQKYEGFANAILAESGR